MLRREFRLKFTDVSENRTGAQSVWRDMQANNQKQMLVNFDSLCLFALYDLTLKMEVKPSLETLVSFKDTT
jgi:hypothetical protein